MEPLIGITCSIKYPERESAILLRSPIPIFFVSDDYSRALEAVGAIPVLVPLVEREKILTGLLEILGGIIITGGGAPLAPELLAKPYLPDLKNQAPERYEFEARLIRHALNLKMPLVGICRGNQMLNEVVGGSTYSRIQTEIPGSLTHHQAGLAPWHEPWHPVSLVPGSQLAGILGSSRIEVNSLHHQAIRKVAPGFRAVAYAPDGVIEAIESQEHPFAFGLQFHPEKMLSEAFAQRFFRAFREAALDYQKKRKGGKRL